MMMNGLGILNADCRRKQRLGFGAVLSAGGFWGFGDFGEVQKAI